MFFPFFSSNAQDKRVADSLINILASARYNDSVRFKIYKDIAFNHNDPEIKLNYANKILEIANGTENSNHFFSGYYLVGTAQNLSGNLKDAIDAFLKAIPYADRLGEKNLLAQTYLSLGDVYSDQENHDNSIHYYSKALNILKGENDELGLSACFMNIGYEYYRVNKTDSAIWYFEKASELFKKVDYKIGILYCKGNKGLAFAKTGKYDLAEKNIQEAIAELYKYEDYYSISDFEKEMAEIYRQRRNFEKAMKYAQHSYNIAINKGLKLQARDASLKIHEIQMDMGQYRNAVNSLERYYSLRDSIINAENIKRMADLRTEFEVGQKQTEVDLLTVQKRNQTIILFALTGFAFILVILAFIIYKYYQSKARTNRILETQKRELEALNQTKDKFFSIISHDLRGPVSSFHGISRMIKFLVESKDTDQLLEITDDIDQSVDRISALLDNLLNWAMQQQGHFPNVPEKVDLNELVDELVQTLNTMAKGKNISLTSQIEPSINLWVDRNTTMTILRNLVNNALKFTPEGGSVNVSAIVKDEVAEIQVADNGVGIPREKLDKLFKLQDKKSTYGTGGEKGLGLGLQLVHEFVEMNKGSIDVSSSQKGTTFIVTLPLFEKVKVEVD